MDGVLDITEENLSEEVVNIVNDWTFYPNKLYSPQDFASGAVETDLEETGSDCRYGTYRLLEGGKIQEDGTYEELMARNGKFAKLVARQQLNRVV